MGSKTSRLATTAPAATKKASVKGKPKGSIAATTAPVRTNGKMGSTQLGTSSAAAVTTPPTHPLPPKPGSAAAVAAADAGKLHLLFV